MIGALRSFSLRRADGGRLMCSPVRRRKYVHRSDVERGGGGAQGI
jgi:hypothetical protein